MMKRTIPVYEIGRIQPIAHLSSIAECSNPSIFENVAEKFSYIDGGASKITANIGTSFVDLKEDVKQMKKEACIDLYNKLAEIPLDTNHFENSQKVILNWIEKLSWPVFS